MKLEKRHIDEMAADFIGHQHAIFRGVSSATDSPIEALMLWALYYVFAKNNVRWDMSRGTEIPEERPTDHDIFLIIQGRIGQYKADFAFLADCPDGTERKVVVECDGHQFHEKTKEQARHDKQRDRYMTDRGWRVYRFTGGEIFRSPLSCAEQVLASIWGALA